MHHTLKAEPESFRLLSLRISDVQLRKNDRNFKPGDTCSFYEWDPVRGFFTGHVINEVKIVTLLLSHEGLTPGWCLIVLNLPQTNICRWVTTLVGKKELP